MDVKQASAYSNKSILSGKLELAQLLPVPYEPDMMMTLNHQHNVYPNNKPSTNPKIRYFGIGIGGRYTVDDEALTSAYKPSTDEAGLYRQIPFRLVPIDEDLTNEERAMYRMRKRETHYGLEYYAYYLKNIEFTEGIKLVRINPKTHIEEPYELDPTKLTPTGKKPPTSGTTDATVTEIKARVKAQITFTGKEVLEVINVLFKGDTRYAVVSELGLYAGIDELVNATSSSGAPISYTESVYAQMMHKQTVNGYDMSHTSDKQIRDVIFSSGTTMILAD